MIDCRCRKGGQDSIRYFSHAAAHESLAQASIHRQLFEILQRDFLRGILSPIRIAMSRLSSGNTGC